MVDDCESTMRPFPLCSPERVGNATAPSVSVCSGGPFDYAKLRGSRPSRLPTALAGGTTLSLTRVAVA
jgi:hypothetical protein